MSNVNATVLVVEDEALIRFAAVDLFERGGFYVLEAANADEAITILEARPEIRLVFTDVDMPGSLDGIKLAQFVRDRWPPIKVVVVSGMRALAEGQLPSGVRFFGKPYEDAAVLAAVTELIAASP